MFDHICAIDVYTSEFDYYESEYFLKRKILSYYTKFDRKLGFNYPAVINLLEKRLISMGYHFNLFYPANVALDEYLDPNNDKDVMYLDSIRYNHYHFNAIMIGAIRHNKPFNWITVSCGPIDKFHNGVFIIEEKGE